MSRVLRALALTMTVVFTVAWVYMVWERTNPNRMTLLPQPELPTLIGDPQSLTIPRLSLTLPIYPAHRTNTSWQTTTKGLSYWVDSPYPGEIGNSVLYGHNWPNLLGSLHKVKPGDHVYVNYRQKQMAFVVQYVTVLRSDNTAILSPSGDARLTLYTCTGFLDSKRLVVTAKLENSSVISTL